MRKSVLILAVLLSCCVSARAGEPMLSIFKENYITRRLPLNTRPAWDTNDLAFQISLKFNSLQNAWGKN